MAQEEAWSGSDDGGQCPIWSVYSLAACLHGLPRAAHCYVSVSPLSHPLRRLFPHALCLQVAACAALTVRQLVLGKEAGWRREAEEEESLQPSTCLPPCPLLVFCYLARHSGLSTWSLSRLLRRSTGGGFAFVLTLGEEEACPGGRRLTHTHSGRRTPRPASKRVCATPSLPPACL